MNKTQIICPLVAMAVAIVIAGILMIPRGQRLANAYFSSRGVSIANELIATTNSQWLVSIGPGLQNKLSEFLAAQSHLDSVKFGDAPPPVGDGKARVRVYLKNSKGELLGIRLRQAQDPDKLEVLGYWNPSEAERSNP